MPMAIALKDFVVAPDDCPAELAELYGCLLPCELLETASADILSQLHPSSFAPFR